MNYFWFKKDLQNSITMPRVHDQLFPSSVFAETKFPAEIVKGLEAIGHKVRTFNSLGQERLKGGAWPSG